MGLGKNSRTGEGDRSAVKSNVAPPPSSIDSAPGQPAAQSSATATAPPGTSQVGSAPSGKGELDKHAAARQRVRTLLDREQEKEAYKEAKTLFRVDTSDETRRLLERSYVARIVALARSGMPTAAKELAEALLAFGVTDTSLWPQLLPLLPGLGLAHRVAALAGHLKSDEVRREVNLAVHDQAVVRPNLADSLTAEARAQAHLARQALEAVSAGEDQRAAELLQAIPRESDYAEWKLFIRGLIAHYRGDSEQARGNWQRLTAGRLPGRMAAALSRSTGVVAAADATATSAAGTSKKQHERVSSATSAASSAELARWETSCFGTPISTHLEGIQRALDAEDARSLIAAVRTASAALARLGPAYATRLTALLLPLVRPLFEDAGPRVGDRLLEEFTRAATPLAFDPNWNRYRALFYEGVGLAWPNGEVEWNEYLEAWAKKPAIGGAHDALRRAIVCEHVARQLLEFSAIIGIAASDEVQMRGQINQWFHDATAACPRLRSAWHGWRQAAFSWGDDQSALKVARQAYQASPDDLESIEFLYEAARAAGRNDEAQELLAAAQRLEPLNLKYLRWAWAQRLSAGLEHLARGEFDEARDKIAAVRSAAPGPITAALSAACEAACAFRVRDLAAAETAVEAVGRNVDPLVGALAMAFAAERCGLSPALNRRFASALGKVSKKRKTAATLAALCAAMEVIVELRRESDGACDYERHLTMYLEKSRRLRLTEEEIERVVRCAGDGLRHDPMRAEWAMIGLAQNPESAYFLWQFGRSASSLSALDPRAVGGFDLTGLQSILIAAQVAVRDPRYRSILPEIQRDLRRAGSGQVADAQRDLARRF